MNYVQKGMELFSNKYSYIFRIEEGIIDLKVNIHLH